MISFEPLWETMKREGITTYYLRNKCGYYRVSSSTICRMKANQSVSTSTLNSLCKILQCSFSDIMEYVEDDEPLNPPQEPGMPKAEYSQKRKQGKSESRDHLD